MNNSNVESILIDQLAKSRGIASDEVLLELERAGGIDSLEGLELTIAAERTFGVEISDDELAKACRSISQLAELVRSKL